jgi:hypothetical protein
LSIVPEPHRRQAPLPCRVQPGSQPWRAPIRPPEPWRGLRFRGPSLTTPFFNDARPPATHRDRPTWTEGERYRIDDRGATLRSRLRGRREVTDDTPERIEKGTPGAGDQLRTEWWPLTPRK